MEIVQFKNGKYGIRRTIKKLFKKPRYEFLRKSYWYWVDQEDKVDIYFDDFDEAKNYIDNGKVISRINYIDNGEVIPRIIRSKK